MSAYAVVLFATTSAALRAEKAAIAAGLPVKLIPTPRQFSSDCGMSLRFDRAQEADMRRVLEEAGAGFGDIRPLS